ncbi:MAG: tRNA 2-thiouridine(34) synthase MnmA [bacterium]|nr:tRNA 2-thiouridine(34) synthase MnmA [bacterium]
MPKRKEKVYVGMSGGVDSSVAAALLKRDGFDVVGVYMKCWTEGVACTSQDDERSARLAADHLNIPFYTWNFLKEYKEKVVDYMLKGYSQGITPNPDIMCNKEIKFGLFYDRAMKLGADYVATGHYVRKEKRGDSFALLKGKDPDKDQSYFLSFIRPSVLASLIFPVGNHLKSEVRAYAKKIGLPNAERKDSQGICFVGKVEMGDFLREHIPTQEGDIVSVDGKLLGKHDGAFYYTIGQREGIGLSGGPYYVVQKEFKTNRLVVSTEMKDILEEEITVKDINWFSKPTENPAKVSAKFRYRQPDVEVTIDCKTGGICIVKPDIPQRAITPGQFAVLYQNETLIGGGVIQ